MFATETACLDATEGKLIVAVVERVDPHVAGLQLVDRAVGFDDRAIHDVCAIVGYFAFVNRIADGLGVELETI